MPERLDQYNVERFNRTVRHEWLELHLFESIEQAQLLNPMAMDI